MSAMAIFRDYRCDELRIARMLPQNLGCLFGSGLVHFALLDIVVR